MPVPYHLIDGYNLLHAAGLARATYGPGDLDRARYGLLARIAEGLEDAERERTTVVFDAADPPRDAASRFRFREIIVLFAVETGEADPLIEELIRRHTSPRQLRVVSDDVRLQRAARRRGAQAVKSEAFLRRLSRRALPTASFEPPAATSAEEWISFFGLDAEQLSTPLEATATAEPPSGPSKASTGEPPARATRERADSEAGPRSKPAEAVEDAAFWQQRIDELIAEDSQRPDGDSKTS